MRNMRKKKQISTSGLAGAVLLASIAAAQASDSQATDCRHKGALGTARILAIDPAVYPRVGLKSFPQTLPLRDHEVVLTFDDGPSPPITRKVLAALEKECVRATFFLIGKPAAEYPDMVRRIAAEGHTVGHHTWSHRYFKQIKPNEATEEIDHGIAADEMALHGVATTTPSTPFFRFPGFESTPATLDLLQSRGIAVLLAKASYCCTIRSRRPPPCCRLFCVICGTTIIAWCISFSAHLARDGKPMTPRHQLKLLNERHRNAREVKCSRSAAARSEGPDRRYVARFSALSAGQRS